MAKDKTLSVRISEKTYEILRSLSLVSRENVSDVAREKIEGALELPDFRKTTVDYISSPRQSFTVILKKYLEHGTLPIGRSDCLFLAYKIQSEAYKGESVKASRFLDLIGLQQSLYADYHGSFPDDRYVLTNLNAYAGEIGRHDEVEKALRSLQNFIESCDKEATYPVDYMARNIIAMIEESTDIEEGRFRKTVAPYMDTLITLASRAVYKDEPGPMESFASYFYEDISINEEEDWFSLRVMSNSSSFWAVLEVKGTPGIVLPLEYPLFARLTAPGNLARLPHAENFMLHLAAGTRLFITPEQADSLRRACTAIRSQKKFKSHDWVLSLLYGVAE